MHLRAFAFQFLASSVDAAIASKKSALQAAAASMKVELQEFPVREASDLPEAFNAMSKARSDAAVINNEPLLNSHTGTIAGLAAYFLDRIFKGAKSGDIAFERAARFDLIVNLKTAKAIGVTIPQSLLLRADRVIE